jgi:hypothetical protein
MRSLIGVQPITDRSARILNFDVHSTALRGRIGYRPRAPRSISISASRRTSVTSPECCFKSPFGDRSGHGRRRPNQLRRPPRVIAVGRRADARVARRCPIEGRSQRRCQSLLDVSWVRSESAHSVCFIAHSGIRSERFIALVRPVRFPLHSSQEGTVKVGRWPGVRKDTLGTSSPPSPTTNAPQPSACHFPSFVTRRAKTPSKIAGERLYVRVCPNLTFSDGQQSVSEDR